MTENERKSMIYQSLEVDESPCDRCHHRYINQYVYDDKREVNADEDSD